MDKKVLRSYYFHSHLLIPEHVAKEAREQPTDLARLEVLLLWQEAHRSTHTFKELDVCYHIDDLDQSLRIDKIVRIKSRPVNGEKSKSRIQSLRVHWHETVHDNFV